ncbi:MAG: toast rack family protein [Brevefilum sp.]
MKKEILFAFLALALASFACSVQNIQMDTIETREVDIMEPLGNTEETQIKFQVTGGKFNLTPTADDLVTGKILYNVEQWEPEFTRSSNLFEIKQVNPFRFSGIPSEDVVNNWDLSLTTQIPLDVSIEGGASENTFDLTGMRLTSLRIVQGASDSTIRFDAPNPVKMETFIFTTGASSADLLGLGNANFSEMSISCGAGNYTFDFNGDLAGDSLVEVKAGVSNISINIPAGTKAVINNEGTVSNINTRGTWLVTDDTYSTMAEGPTLTINLDMAVGNVNLVHEE